MRLQTQAIRTRNHGQVQAQAQADARVRARTVRPLTHRSITIRGFSLIELMVVVAIIIIMLSVGIASLTMAFQRSEEAQTQIVLAALQSIADEYRAQTGVNLYSQTDINDMESFIEAVREIQACDTMLRALGPAGEIVIYDDGGVGDDASSPVRTVRDPWGEDIVYFRHNRSGVSGYDGAHPEREGYFFVSYGADNAEGDFDGTTEQREQHEDNIYSYDMN